MKNLNLYLLSLMTFAGFVCVSITIDTNKAKSPNVVIIYMDDLGYGDLSCYGALDYRTPNIDRLANEGIRFTNFLSAQAVCSASRVALLTGCYSNRVGFWGAYGPNAKVGIHEDETTLAELVKAKGYATAIFGKWHLGDNKKFLPLQHGFDEYVGLPYSNDMWPVWYDGTPATIDQHRKANYPPLPLIEGNEKIRTLSKLEHQGELTTLYTEKAVDFIQRNKNKPFFLYVPHSMPHVPIEVSSKFKGKSGAGMYGDLMMEVDWSVGEIMKALKQNGLEENTLIVFSSDNGPWLNYGNHAGNTGGFREGKGTIYEGGHRVPGIMRWKGKTASGVVYNQMASTIDIFPTVAEIIGAELPKHKIDGVSLLPLLTDGPNASPRDEFYYYYNRNSLKAVRKGNWKLVFAHKGRSYVGSQPGNDGFPGPSPESIPFEQGLYDLRRDPSEAYDVSETYPEKLAELMTLAEKARKDLGDDLTNREGTGRRPIGTVE